MQTRVRVQGGLGCGFLAAALAAIALPATCPAQSTPTHLLFVESQMNSDDLYLGASYRLAVLPAWGLGVQLVAGIRPYREWVLEPLRPRVYLQLREIRYLMGAALDQIVPIGGPLALFGSVGMAFTAADYDGTHRRPSEGWQALLGGGMSVALVRDRRLAIDGRLGYRRIPLEAASDGWLYFAVGTNGTIGGGR